MTTPTRRAALTALASASALAIPAIAVAKPDAPAESEKITTAEQWAAMNFEPLTIDEMPTYEEWQAMAESHAVTPRIARMTLTKTKDEVKEIFRGNPGPVKAKPATERRRIVEPAGPGEVQARMQRRCIPAMLRFR